MSGAFIDVHGSVIVVDPSDVEVGPLRPSDLSESERTHMPPHWAWLNHDALPYETRSDHRAQDGRIVSRGTATLTERSDRWLIMHLLDGRTVQLVGERYCIPIPEAPLYRVA